MIREKICHWINANEKLKGRSCISCGQDAKRYWAGNGVFTISHPV